MRIAIISDIHSNLEALQQVLSCIDGAEVDEVNCLGDIVGYGPFPEECVTLVRQRCAVVVRGNHDAGAVGEEDLKRFNANGRTALQLTMPLLSTVSREFLASLPLTVVSGPVTAVHASPVNPERWNYLTGWDRAREAFSGFSTPFCAFGHSHIPLVVAEDGSVNPNRLDKKVLINPGSVGQPRDGDPSASFAILDTVAEAASIIRVQYDIERTAQALRKGGFPEPLARRLFLGI